MLGPAITKSPVTLVVVTCGDRFEVTMANLKSAVAFSRAHLRLVLFADVENIQRIQDTIQEWPISVLRRVTYELRLVRLPKEPKYRSCSYQRIFLPSMLPQEDAVLYVDSDIIFVHPVEDLWSYFGEMNDQQLVLMISDVEDMPLNPYFNRTPELPHYGRYGLNAGLMLMNLTRMRNFGFEALLLTLMDEYLQQELKYIDQDLINIVFHDNPEKILQGPCKWNFMHVVCWSNTACKDETPTLIHGTYQTFSHPTRATGLRSIGMAMQQYRLGTNLERNFIDALEENLKSAGDSLCSNKVRSFVKDWRELARQLDTERGW